ncbi:Helix-hairpin-helix motif-containing protein [Gaiella occulta]|uniref:Helix-hairpin-helix motif-containing protein n=2 Tax=Gaiella occulta TaxID=1002870 RepID=A0A7M2YWA6_9ACTN|nr:Helix-hairpin-helix motif-containing protein [Gaiella occulta]
MDDMLEVLPRRQTAILLAAALLVLALVGKRLASQGSARAPAPAATLAPTGSGAAGAAPAPRIVVDVVGAVRRAGVYRLPDGSRVLDAVRRAGGPTRRAQIALVNLAAPLADGQQVVVPARGVPGAAGGAGAAAAKVSLASATVDDLDALPGIGPVTAQKIVDWRQGHGPFRSVEDLDAVPGVGPARIEQLRDLVTP